MALLRVVAVDLLARLADLLDDHELGAALDDPLDIGILVSGYDDESVALGDDPLVLRRRDLDLAEAHAAAAFAMKRLPSRGTVLLGAPSSIRSLTPRKISSLRAARSAKFMPPSG